MAETRAMSRETPPLELNVGKCEWQMNKMMDDLESLQMEESANYCPKS